MPEAQFDRRLAKGFLLLLVPTALLVAFIFVAWPFILGATLVIVGISMWQSYRWSRTIKAIDPHFQEIVHHHRGEVAPIDIANRAKVSGAVAQRYLLQKAQEFGTASRQDPQRGAVFYFVSVGTLGRILDDSELTLPLPTPPVAAKPIVAAVSPLTVPAPPVKPIDATVAKIAEPPPINSIPLPTEPKAKPEPPPLDAAPVLESPPPLDVPVPESQPPSVAEALVEVAEPEILSTDHLQKILKSDLAKRLEVQPSTLYKRRNETDFTEWTRSRDPDGQGWGFLSATKEFYQVDD
jgi:hypothetical protein